MENRQEQEKTFAGDGYVHCFGCGDCFGSIYMSILTKSYASHM